MPDRDQSGYRINPVWYGAVLLIAIIITLVALSVFGRSDMHPTDHDETGVSESAFCWQADLPEGWRMVPNVDGGVRFVAEGFTVGGIERLPELPQGERDLTSLLSENWVILSSMQVAVAAGWGVVFDISVPVHSDESASERGFETGESQSYIAAPTRPETHCLVPLDGVTLDVWTRENTGFPPKEARDAAFSILQSLGLSGEYGEMQNRLPGEVMMIAAISDEAYPDGRIWGAFDVEATVRNVSDEDASDFKVLITKAVSNPAYLESDTEVDTSLDRISSLDPKADYILRIPGLEMSLPEKDYEVTVDIIGGGRPLKLGVRMAFPPGSED